MQRAWPKFLYHINSSLKIFQKLKKKKSMMKAFFFFFFTYFIIHSQIIYETLILEVFRVREFFPFWCHNWSDLIVMMIPLRSWALIVRTCLCLKKIRPMIVTMLLISFIVQCMFQLWESDILFWLKMPR